MTFLLTAIALLLALGVNITFAAHAGFHVQFPWATRGPSPRTRSVLDRYNPFCGTFPCPPLSAPAA